MHVLISRNWKKWVKININETLKRNWLTQAKAKINGLVKNKMSRKNKYVQKNCFFKWMKQDSLLQSEWTLEMDPGRNENLSGAVSTEESRLKICHWIMILTKQVTPLVLKT